VYVESRIAQLSYKLTIMNEGLKRLELNLELLSELHAAPQKYLMAVGEVVRRRTFSSAFLKVTPRLNSKTAEKLIFHSYIFHTLSGAKHCLRKCSPFTTKRW